VAGVSQVKITETETELKQLLKEVLASITGRPDVLNVLSVFGF